jgi:hypothetical protein
MKARIFWLAVSVALLMVMLGLCVHASATAVPSDSGPRLAGGAVAAWVPSTLHAAQEETFRLVFTVLPSGLPEGSRLKVQDADFHGMGWTMFQGFQTVNPTAEGYLTVACSAPGVSVSVVRAEAPGVQDLSYTVVTVDSGNLAAGDTITLTYGDASVSPLGRATSPHPAYRRVTWPIFVDTDGGGFRALAELPTMDIAPDPNPVHMFATGPTYVQAGVPFELSVRVLDAWGNACIDYGETLNFASTDEWVTLPTDTAFPAGAGFRRFPITLNTTGIHYIFVDDGGSFTVNSNPIVVLDELPEEQIFWGDLHGHHGHVYSFTVGVSPAVEVRVDEYMEYARDVSDLDFVCESHKSSAYWNVPQVHEEIAASILQYESGEFVPFRGFEWMGKQAQNEGHHNVYYLAADGPYWSPIEADSDSLDELYRKVANSGYEALIIPHASSYSGHNWSKFLADDLNARFRRQAEIYSHWDLSEELDPGSVRTGWVTGNRMGIMASTDNHYNFPGLPIGDVCEEGPGGPICVEGRTAVGGLTAVYAPHLTRQHLWQGLKQRHTYGTDGRRIYLEFTADGVLMGEQYRTTSAPHIEVVAAGTAEIDRVEVIRGTYAEVPANPGPTEEYYTTVYSDSPGTLVTAFALDDTGFSEDCFYYVRVTQIDGRRAWSSPIWVDYAPPPADLWSGCGDGKADPGENLVTCAPDTRFSQSSERLVTDGRPHLLANGVSVPMTGLRVYNYENVDSYLPYGTPGWLEFMQRQVDRVKFAGAHYMAINAYGMRLYTGGSGSDPGDPSNWWLEPMDYLFAYAAEQGVYLIPTVQTDAPPLWWLESNEDAMQTDDEGTIWGRVTFNNTEYWTLADELLTHFVQHYRDHPALLAWDFRVGEGENNYSPPYVQNVLNPPDTWCDYSPQALANFRAWLTAKYTTDDALRTAWLSPTVTLATAEIPLPREEVTPSSEIEILPYVNGPGDVRPEFYDWHHFRLEEKIAETAHFGALFRSLDPDHVILSDPAYVPLASGTQLRWGTQDGETLYRSPYIDAVIEQPRFGHTDQGGGFTVARERLYMATQYALHHGRLQTWAKEETSEMNDPGGDQENLWRLGSAAALQAALGQGDGWVTGSVTDTMLPAWSDGERAEMARLAGLFSAPGLRSPQPEIAILTDPLDAFDYFVGGRVAAPCLRGADRGQFLESLWKNGLGFDLLTVDDVRLDPGRLAGYRAILIVNQARLPLDVAEQVAAYRDGGGGLFVGGRTGIFDELGRPDDSALETLLGVTILDMQTADYEAWSFDSAPTPLLDGLEGEVYADDNLYHVPTFNVIVDGYTPLGHLSGAPLVATAGYRGPTVFWFPRLSTETSGHLTTFQRNLWTFFGVEPPATGEGEVEIAGDTHLALFSPISQTVKVRYPVTMAGTLVWDWNAMDLVGPVPPSPEPELSLDVAANSTAFLGTFVPASEPRLVAISGASLARTGYLSATNTFAVVLYRSVPGLQIQVAIDSGDLLVEDAAVEGGGLDHAGFDRSGQVYLVQATPTEERMTVSVQFERVKIYLPIVTKSY